MIKKLLHFICVIVACIIWCAMLVGIVYSVIYLVYQTTPLAFYHGLSRFWNNGNVLHGKDLAIIFMVLAFIPLFLYGCCKLYGYKYMKLLTVPLNKIFNSGFEGYVAPDVNIKNLKIEEKKSLEQIVQERIDMEKKKSPVGNSADFRKQIISKIQETKNN